MITINKEITLRQLALPDAIDIFNTINSQREYLGKWLPFVAYTKEVTDTEKFVQEAVSASEKNFEYIFTIRKHDEFIGIIGFKETDRVNKKTEIGYWLSELHQKQGIVTKAVDKLCTFAFNKLDINRIQIKCAVDNKPSSRIPQRLGFKFEGIERQGELLTGNVFTDLEVYSKLKMDIQNE
jgi:ribosomal-protein-serine acetyltransferase